MSLFGPAPIPPPSRITPPSSRRERRSAARDGTVERDSDEVELQNAQTTDAVRDLTGYAQEETEADHRRQGDPQRATIEGERPRIDIRG